MGPLTPLINGWSANDAMILPESAIVDSPPGANELRFELTRDGCSVDATSRLLTAVDLGRA